MITAHPGAQLSFQQRGHGPCPLLLFHGFGQTHAAFIPLADALAETHTCYLFDLYFHGDSVWHLDEQPLDKVMLQAVLSDFLVEQQIDKFAVGGFSLGGKFALAMVEAFPDRIQDLYLIAPDGIKTSLWYSLATYPVPLRKLFKSMIKKPGLFLSLANFCNRIGVVDRGLIRFASSQMATEEQRRRVYYSWTVFRHLNFDLKKIAALINDNQMNVVVVVGEFDKVIRAKNMNRLMKYLAHQKLIVLSTGHNGLLKSAELVGIVRGE
jgi:pimeloyl-ACP methyl ester carboxylesterase